VTAYHGNGCFGYYVYWIGAPPSIYPHFYYLSNETTLGENKTFGSAEYWWGHGCGGCSPAGFFIQSSSFSSTFVLSGYQKLFLYNPVDWSVTRIQLFILRADNSKEAIASVDSGSGGSYRVWNSTYGEIWFWTNTTLNAGDRIYLFFETDEHNGAKMFEYNSEQLPSRLELNYNEPQYPFEIYYPPSGYTCMNPKDCSIYDSSTTAGMIGGAFCGVYNFLVCISPPMLFMWLIIIGALVIFSIFGLMYAILKRQD
jgi:hypothetical protein